MVKKQSTTKLLSKIAIRTIFKQWLQFLAIILINAVAVTLFVGLCSNADNIKKRTNTLYEGGNVADIWTNVTMSDSQDSEAIDLIVGDAGYTETRYALNAEISSRSFTALMSKDIPTINAPYLCDNEATDGFFIVDSRLFSDARNPETWDAWIDENGYYKEQTVSFNFASVQSVLKNYSLDSIIKDNYSDYYERIEDLLDRIPDGLGTTIKNAWDSFKNKTVLDVFDACVKDNNSTNIFNNSTIDLSFQVTGSMMFAENVQSSLMNASNFLLDIDMFKAKLKEAAYSNYEKPSITDIGEENYLFRTIIGQTNILDIAIDMIVNSYTFNTYCTKLNDKSYVEPVKEAIQDYFNSKPDGKNNLIMCSDIDSITSNVTIQNDIKQARQLAYIFPVVFFLVAILVVITTFSQIILKERTQIGTLKAIGVSKTRILVHYLLITSIVILIGAIIGCIIGPVLLSYIMNIKYAILYTLPPMGYVIAIPEALLSTLASVLLSGLVTFLVVRKEIKLSPSESMRPASPRTIKTRATSNAKKPVAIAINMAFRNIRVNITKSLMVIIGIMGCTALLVCGFGVDDTLNFGVKHDMDHYFNADITLSYSTVTSHKDDILAIPGVTRIEEASFLPSTIIGESSLYDSKVFCIEDNSEFFLGDNGYEIKEDVAITQKEADALKLKVGDYIEFSVPLVRKDSFIGRVGAIFETFYIHGVIINSAFNDYSEIMKYQNNGYVRVDDYDNVKNIGEQIKGIDGVLSYKTRDENNETISSYMSSISLMTLAVKVFAIILAVVVLYNLALLNFKERNRDIATMKVLGFNQLEIMLSLIIEVMVLTIIGIAFGMVLGKPLEVLVLMVNRTPVVEFLYTVFVKTYFIAFAITFVTGLIVNLFLSLKARSVKMVESLKSVD